MLYYIGLKKYYFDFMGDDTMMSRCFNNYVYIYEAQQQENLYEGYLYENKTIANTLEHAEQDAENAKEHLSRAKEYYRNGDIKKMNRECRSATKDAIDSTEKYGKVVANMVGKENEICVTHTGRQEKVNKTHSITGLNNTINEISFLSADEAGFMDSFSDFSDEQNKCYNSHTGLSYGDVTPTVEEAERAVNNMIKVQKEVNNFRAKVKAAKLSINYK